MCRLVLRVLMTASVVLACGPRQVLGLPCACGIQAHVDNASAHAASCSCCHQDAAPQDASDQEPAPGKSHCPGCTEWCCGAGFVPLTLAVPATPFLDLMPETALGDLPFLICEGFRPRIEHPPRFIS